MHVEGCLLEWAAAVRSCVACHTRSDGALIPGAFLTQRGFGFELQAARLCWCVEVQATPD